MKLLIGLTAGLVLSLSSGAAAAAGGMTSSGGDSHSIGFESAWFLGSEPVSYCIELGPREKVTTEKARADFDSALATWKKYYEERALSVHPATHRLNFNYHYESCGPKTRLKILIGAKNADTEKARVLYEDPYAFVYRTEYDMDTGMGRGLIWLNEQGVPNRFPDWTATNVLHGVFLHEIGHVLGCGHLKNTVMEPELVSKLQDAASNDPSWARYGKMFMTTIDHHFILFGGPRARLSMKGSVGLNQEEQKRLFQWLTGRAPKGFPRAEVLTTGGEIELRLNDDEKTDTLKIALKNRTAFSLGNQLFYAVLKNQGWSSGTSGEIFVTQLTTVQGETVAAEVSFNADELGWPIRVRAMEKGEMKDIFHSDLWVNTGLPR